MADTQTTTKLNINVLGYTEYDGIITKNPKELYVVKQDNSDTDNSISSRSYADVGRDAIYVGNDEPTSQYAKLWVDLDEQTNFVHPADVDMDNLTATGMSNLQKALVPRYSSGVAISNTAGESFTTTAVGWLFVSIDESSEIELFVNNASGAKLVSLKSYNEKLTDNVLVNKNTVIFINKRSGTTRINFYPCLGANNA